MASASPLRAESAFLRDVIDSLARRRKALKHQGAVPQIERVVEVKEGVTLERIEITCRQATHQTFNLIVWEDRHIWVHGCEAVKNAGWKFQATSQGRFPGSIETRALIEAIEASLAAMHGMTDETTARFEAIWRPLLASGPRAVGSGA